MSGFGVLKEPKLELRCLPKEVGVAFGVGRVRVRVRLRVRIRVRVQIGIGFIAPFHPCRWSSLLFHIPPSSG